MLITLFQSVLMDVPFSKSGSKIILGLSTVNRRMVACALFAASVWHGSDPGVLVNRPITNFKKALEVFRNHADMDHHKDAVVRAEGFLITMVYKQPDIRHTLNKVMDERIKKNRLKLTSIFETVLFCGRNNIALRGHRDNATDVEKDTYTSENPSHGNFRALLQFRVQAGDTILADHIATAAHNATYTSPGIQNEIIEVLGDHADQATDHH